MVQGTLDNAVSRDTALRLLDHIQADDLHLTLTKGQIILFHAAVFGYYSTKIRTHFES